MKGKMAKKGIELVFLPFLAFITKMYYLWVTRTRFLSHARGVSTW